MATSLPALGLGHGDTLALVLNTPPSFVDPKSVLMVALPAIRPPAALMPHREAGAPSPCLGATAPLMPLAISPLYYATTYARDLVLRVPLPGQTSADVPIVPDPVRGGLVIAPGTVLPGGIAGPIAATVHGMWGFEPFTGPEITLTAPGDWHWQRKDAGKEDGPIALTGAASACVVAVTVKTPHGTPQPVKWKVAKADEITVSLPSEADRHDLLTVAIAGPDGTGPAMLTVAPPARAQPPAARIAARFSESPAGDVPQGQPVIQLDGADEIPANARLNFTLKAAAGDHFSGHEVIEIGTAGSDATIRLTTGSGLTQVDPTVLVASLNRRKRWAVRPMDRCASGWCGVMPMANGWRSARWCACPASGRWIARAIGRRPACCAARRCTCWHRLRRPAISTTRSAYPTAIPARRLPSRGQGPMGCCLCGCMMRPR